MYNAVLLANYLGILKDKKNVKKHCLVSFCLRHYLLLKCVFTILIFPLPVHSTHNSCTWEYSSSSNLLALSACFTNDPEDQHERQCYNNHESARLKYTNKLLKIIEYYMSITNIIICSMAKEQKKTLEKKKLEFARNALKTDSNTLKQKECIIRVYN